MPHRQLTTYQAVISQARAFRALRTFMADTLKRYDLTLTEWLMIGSVVDTAGKGIRISELADLLGVEMPVITNLVNRAEKTGWVTRLSDPDDKRAKLVYSTKEGGQKACDIEGDIRSATSEWLNDLDPEQLLGYLTVVGALAAKPTTYATTKNHF